MTMAEPLNLTLALERYDRHFPFFDNTLQLPEGLNLKVYQTGQSVPLRDGKDRHERMLHDGDFDVAEFSLSTFLMARARGMPIVGIPVLSLIHISEPTRRTPISYA